MSRNWNHEWSDKGCSIGERNSSFSRHTTMINAADRANYRHAYVLWFGAYGWTRLHVYADSLEDALESCAEWLADHAPGLIMKHGSDEHNELLKEACEEMGLAWPIPPGTDDFEPYWKAEEQALADQTYTESGYIASWEWGIGLEDPTAAELYAYVTGN